MARIDERALAESGYVRLRTARKPQAVRESARSIDQIEGDMTAIRIAEACEAAASAAREDVLAHAAAALDRTVESLEAARERAEDAIASDAVELAVEIARQIVKLRFDAGEYDLETIVRSTLAASNGRTSRCVVHVHPDDADQLRGVTFRGETEILPDPTLSRGNVHLETPRGLLVRDADAAIDEIREQLLEDLVR